MAASATTEMPASWSTGNFVRHFIEMVVAMMVGMMVLGAASRGFLALIGEREFIDNADARVLLMTANMTIGMALWMSFRHHNWMNIGEMSVAMVFPFVVLIGPHEAGMLSDGALSGAVHALMLPAMLGVMLLRRSEYGRDHREHLSGHAGMHGA